MILIGIVFPWHWITLMAGNPLVIIIDFNGRKGVLDLSGFTNVPIWHTVIALIWRKVNVTGFLHFRSPVFFYFIGR
jgi:hypothetical protein